MDGSNTTRLEVASPDCVAEDFDGEIVAINLNTGRYFSMRGLSGAVWRDLAAGHAVEDVRRELTAANAVLGEKFDTFVRTLTDNALLRRATTNGAPPRGGESAGAASGDANLVVECYDDMKELLLADPIHEVDEQVGWPRRKSD